MTQDNQNLTDETQEELSTEEIVDETQESSEVVEETDQMSSQSAQSTQSGDQTEALLRLKADYDNLVKRHAREQAEMKTFFTASIVGKLLPAYDNIARIASQSNAETSSEVLLSGIKSTAEIFEKGLASLGVNKFESVGHDVDPARHDVMSQGPGPAGKIIADFESGFTLGDTTVVRHAKVVVGMGE